jgi:hypothetical protein
VEGGFRTTVHGAMRIAGAAATRGGVLCPSGKPAWRRAFGAASVTEFFGQQARLGHARTEGANIASGFVAGGGTVQAVAADAWPGGADSQREAEVDPGFRAP